MLDDMKEVVISDSYGVAKSTMRHEWRWTPQRIKRAIVLSREVDISRVRNLEMAYIYIVDYPERFDQIWDLITEPKFMIGNPWKGSTIDPQFFTSQAS